MNSSGVSRATTSPISSSERSSSFLKRTQHLPMSSFLPVFAQASLNHCSSSPYTPIR